MTAAIQIGAIKTAAAPIWPTMANPNCRCHECQRRAEVLQCLGDLQRHYVESEATIASLNKQIARETTAAIASAGEADAAVLQGRQEIAEMEQRLRDACPLWAASAIAVIGPVVGYLFRAWLYGNLPGGFQGGF